MDKNEKEDREAQRELIRDVAIYLFLTIVIALIIIF